MNAKTTIWHYMFVWLMLDSLILYLLRPFNIQFPINTGMPFLIAIAYMISKRRTSLLPLNYIGWLGLTAVGFLLAVAIGADELYGSLKDMIGAFCAFIIGYNAVARSSDLKGLYNLILFTVLLYCVVCVAALLGASSTYLPVINSYGFNKGIPVVRAELTTDQNYQIYYLFPLALGLAIRQQFWKYGLICLGTLASMFIIVRLETRSGLIVMALTFIAAALLPAWYRQRGGMIRIGAIGFAGLALIVYKLRDLAAISEGMKRRFTDDDMGTFWGRIESIAYLFQHVYDPSWWIPQGNDVFVKQFAHLPHSSTTKVFLEAGLLGLIGWVVLLIVPTIKGSLMIWSKRLSIDRAGIVLGAIVSLIAAFTLPASLFKQCWLWAGAACGAFASQQIANRMRRQALETRFAENMPQPSGNRGLAQNG